VWAVVLALSLGISSQVLADNGRGPAGQIVREALNLLVKGSTYSESVDMLFDVKSGGALSLGTTNGSIRVETWEKEKIRLIITKTTRAASAFDAKALLAKFLVQTRRAGKDLHLVGKAQTKECREAVGVTFTVWVPKSYNVAVKTGTGSIDIGRLNGKFSAHTKEGKITLGYDPDDGLDIEVEDRTADASDVDSTAPVVEGAAGPESEESPGSGDEEPGSTEDESNSPATGNKLEDGLRYGT
jgi:hypothetical protein